jgi:hypothetical protein
MVGKHRLTDISGQHLSVASHSAEQEQVGQSSVVRVSVDETLLSSFSEQRNPLPQYSEYLLNNLDLFSTLPIQQKTVLDKQRRAKTIVIPFILMIGKLQKKTDYCKIICVTDTHDTYFLKL